MYQQRSAPQQDSWVDRGLWRPAPEGEAIEFSPAAGDRYAVLDDLEAEHVILVLDRWPTVDAAGHLVFSGAAVAWDFPASEFQALVDQRRTEAGQPAADRALRVGDVFWIRVGDDKRLEAPAGWRLLDVTSPARRAARAAQLVAANPALRAPTLDTRPDAPQAAAGRLVVRPATGAAPPAV